MNGVTFDEMIEIIIDEMITKTIKLPEEVDII
jgi:hypothetical protein